MPSTSAVTYARTESDPWPMSVAPHSNATPPFRCRRLRLLRRDAEAKALVAPAGGLDDLVNAFAEADRRDRQGVGGLGERRGGDPPPEPGRIEAELLGGLIDLALEREAGLGRAVAALGPARRLVGEDARPLELVDRNLVGHRVDTARVERRGDAVRAVGASVEPRAEMATGDVTALRESRLDPHQHGGAAAGGVEDLLAGPGDLDGPAGEL